MLLMIVVKLTPYFRLFGLPHSLQERKATQWGDAVQLVFSDMRSFTPSVQADIIVSELLGSFGDNELSPEWVPERPFIGLGGVMADSQCFPPDASMASCGVCHRPASPSRAPTPPS
jgi:hypothetical protein